jgi:hypothetical protein
LGTDTPNEFGEARPGKAKEVLLGLLALTAMIAVLAILSLAVIRPERQRENGRRQ